jgi:hypothetical protein
MNDLDDEPAVKKEEVGMESEGGMDTIEAADEKGPFIMAKISNTEIQELLHEIARLTDKAPNHQDTRNLKLEHSLLAKANETIARINLEIANIYKVCI